ncbi:MAG: dienelactone hydrolase family protein [Candidatus Obscuribacterales bacterium]|nr:dienelactone hydrolase family protein [Candidatus Obscuribacterales bacterium]
MRALLLLCISLCLVAPCFAGATAANPSRGVLIVNNLQRRYHLYVPESVKNLSKAPIVIVLHGGFEDWQRMRRNVGIDQKAKECGFIVVYPEATGIFKPFLFWNAIGCCGKAVRQDIDDVGFISELIDFLVLNRQADPSRVYVAGYSNGAMLAYRLACELSPKIAAIACVGGAMSGKEQPPVMPVPVIIFHGSDDRHVPYKGGPGKWAKFGYPVNGKSVEYASQFWRDVNGCGVISRRQEDGRVHKELYSNGKNGSEVEVITISGAGHAWPGGKKSRIFSNPPYPGLNATDECWNFFSRHKRAVKNRGIDD